MPSNEELTWFSHFRWLLSIMSQLFIVFQTTQEVPSPAESACKGSACPIGTRAMRCMRCTMSRTRGSWRPPDVSPTGETPKEIRKKWVESLRKNVKIDENWCLEDFEWSILSLEWPSFDSIGGFEDFRTVFCNQKEWKCAGTRTAAVVIHSEFTIGIFIVGVCFCIWTVWNYHGK